MGGVSKTRKILLTGAAIAAVGLSASTVHALRSDQDRSPPANTACDLSARAGERLALPGCPVIASDTAADRDPLPFWGRIDCAASSRYAQHEQGGDAAPRADGRPQGDDAFRRMRVFKGDWVSGERCELGLNDRSEGPTVLYYEGERRITFASLRLPTSWDIDDPNWRVVLQMKQVQPYNNPALASMFELQARSGHWLLVSDWHDLWRTPAQTGQWTRFAFDVTYSRDPEIGRINVYVDLNGDGDAADPDERSPTIERATLRQETEGEQTAIPVGQSIPSHLRAGLYLNPTYKCPPPAGCWADVDNVQVLRADE